MLLQGCFSQSLVVSTVYATLGADAVKDAVVDGHVYGLMCNREKTPTLRQRIKGYFNQQDSAEPSCYLRDD